jgi:CRISPR/Cas system Type II protein with McrA/HNH and RuvC-like nuclease domain
MNNTDLIFSTSDLNYASYIKLSGYEISNVYTEYSKKHNKEMTFFVFYQSPKIMQLLINEYLNSDICRFYQIRSDLMNSLKQTKILTHDELLKKLNAI